MEYYLVKFQGQPESEAKAGNGLKLTIRRPSQRLLDVSQSEDVETFRKKNLYFFLLNPPLLKIKERSTLVLRLIGKRVFYFKF